MRTIHIIDTTVYLEILKVPKHFDEDRYQKTTKHFEEYLDRRDTLLLPFGTIIEAGNHIADAIDGRRYGLIKRFVDDVESAIRYKTPYKLCGIARGNTGIEDVQCWIEKYGDLAVSGVGMVDAMCIAIFEEMKSIYPHDRIRIWSFDKRHLSSYDTQG